MKEINNLVERFKDKLEVINFNDIVDIALIALIFFFIYKFIRRRRALPILLGVAVYLIVMELCRLFYMDATYELLKWFTLPGTVALFIIFQSEIRSGLEKLGSTIINIGRVIKHKLVPLSASPEAEAIQKAVLRFSEARTGALIVLEKNTGIEDVVQDGIRLDAYVSYELLCSLFHAPGPLHDGAIIIRKKRIIAASCILPNYSDASINSAFGTRHRAAIGTSRNSDAIVIVVSEEDGRISFAKGEEMTRGIDADKLLEILNEYYGVSVRKSSEEAL